METSKPKIALKYWKRFSTFFKKKHFKKAASEQNTVIIFKTSKQQGSLSWFHIVLLRKVIKMIFKIIVLAVSLLNLEMID